MSARWFAVEGSFWLDPRIKRVDSDTKLLAAHSTANVLATSEGFYAIPKAYIAADLGWSVEKVEKCLKTLDEVGWLAYDDENEVLLVLDAMSWKTRSPGTEKHLIGAVRMVKGLRHSPLYERFIEQAEKFGAVIAWDEKISDPEDGRRKIKTGNQMRTTLALALRGNPPEIVNQDGEIEGPPKGKSAWRDPAELQSLLEVAHCTPCDRHNKIDCAECRADLEGQLRVLQPLRAVG